MSRQLRVSDVDELSELAHALDRRTEQLEERMRVLPEGADEDAGRLEIVNRLRARVHGALYGGRRPA